MHTEQTRRHLGARRRSHLINSRSRNTSSTLQAPGTISVSIEVRSSVPDRLRDEPEAVRSHHGATTNGHDATVVRDCAPEVVRMGRRQSKRFEGAGKIQEGYAVIRRDRDANGPGQGHRLAPWQNFTDLVLSATCCQCASFPWRHLYIKPAFVSSKDSIWSLSQCAEAEFEARTFAGVCCAAMPIQRSEAGYRLGSDRGSPNHGSTLLSKRVMAQIRSPVRVRT